MVSHRLVGLKLDDSISGELDGAGSVAGMDDEAGVLDNPLPIVRPVVGWHDENGKFLRLSVRSSQVLGDAPSYNLGGYPYRGFLQARIRKASAQIPVGPPESHRIPRSLSLCRSDL